jgi:hypothetical protein
MAATGKPVGSRVNVGPRSDGLIVEHGAPPNTSKRFSKSGHPAVTREQD